jgi:hypothetical protein
MSRTSINIENYEAWLLDLAEGSLSAQEEAQLRAFVSEHPELNIDLSDIELFYLDNQIETGFDLKSNLKHTEINQEEADNILFEGLENPEKQAAVEKLLFENPSYTIDFKAFVKTKLAPDLSIQFENKALLKRTLEIGIDKEQTIAESIENNASDSHIALLIQQLPDLKAIILAYQKARISPDFDITFEDKALLKHSLILQEGIAFKTFELTEMGSEKAIQAFITQNPHLKKEVLAYQKARLEADLSIIYEKKSSSKKPLFVFWSARNLSRVAAILIGVSILGFGIYQYQSGTDETQIANNTVKVSDSINTFLVKTPELANEMIDANSNDKAITSSISETTQTPKTLAKQGTAPSKKIIVVKESDPISQEVANVDEKQNTSIDKSIRLKEQVPQRLDDITIEVIPEGDPAIAKIEDASRKAMPTIVLQDLEESETNEYGKKEEKDPLLYKAANSVNKLLSFIGTKKIPVEKKEKKENVSYKVGKDIFSYSKNKKMQP